VLLPAIVADAVDDDGAPRVDPATVGAERIGAGCGSRRRGEHDEQLPRVLDLRDHDEFGTLEIDPADGRTLRSARGKHSRSRNGPRAHRTRARTRWRVYRRGFRLVRELLSLRRANARHRRTMTRTTMTRTAGNASLVLLAGTLLALFGAETQLASTVQAQRPAINLGQGIGIRIENSANHDSGSPVGQIKLVVNTLLDTNSTGPFVVTLEQARRVLATASCEAQPVVYSGEAQDGQGYLSECVTNNIPAAALRTNAPADVVIAVVDDATDARIEIYRGTFPVIAFSDWTGNDNAGRPVHIEQRALRQDSFYGVGFVRQYIADEIGFSYVDTQNTGDLPRESAMRCRIGTGEWRAYEASHGARWMQTARNRAYVGGRAHEDGPETIVTQVVSFTSRMPIAVAGRDRAPSAGSSMDGAWTCEFRWGGAGTRVVAREFRFVVRSGYIVPHAIESQIAPGRGTVLVAIGMNSGAMPVIFDPALVRDTVAGRRLTGATAPLVSTMPGRATNPSFTVPRGGRRRR